MADASATSPQDQVGSAHRTATQPSVVGLPGGRMAFPRGDISARSGPALNYQQGVHIPEQSGNMDGWASGRGWEGAETTPCRVLTQSGALRPSGVPAPVSGPCGGAGEGAQLACTAGRGACRPQISSQKVRYEGGRVLGKTASLSWGASESQQQGAAESHLRHVVVQTAPTGVRQTQSTPSRPQPSPAVHGGSLSSVGRGQVTPSRQAQWPHASLAPTPAHCRHYHLLPKA